MGWILWSLISRDQFFFWMDVLFRPVIGYDVLQNAPPGGHFETVIIFVPRGTAESAEHFIKWLPWGAF
jgi:hypothetical protein